jgi:hypothetical protein
LEITASVSSTAVRSDAAFEVHLNANVPVGTHPQAGYSFRFAIDGTTPPLLLRGGLVLARANASGVRLRSGTTYRIAAQRHDGELSLSIDGVPVISIKDTPLESGALDIVGLAVRGCSVNLESLAVYTL